MHGRWARGILLAVLLGFLAWALWVMVIMWTRTEVTMSGHGWAALVLGVVFSCVVGFGLMALVFLSSHRGYDEPPKFHRDNDRSDRHG
jgi:hypothetical protein